MKRIMHEVCSQLSVDCCPDEIKKSDHLMIGFFNLK